MKTKTICITVNVQGLGEVEAYGQYIKGSPAIMTGPADNWVPEEPSEFIFEKALVDVFEISEINKVSAEEWLEQIHVAVIDHIEGN